jgi:predicted ATPase
MVGRSDEVRQALTALGGDAEFRGVVLMGGSGVGKSTLARALANILESRELNVRFVLCTETGRAVPFGAFYWLTTLVTAREPAVMLAAAQRALEQEENLVVAVDDAHLLDPLSASLVYHLAARGSARLIVTITSGHALPDPVIAMCKERLLLTLRVEAFTRQQTELLAHTVLGGDVATELIDELQDRTAGNPLFLRGLLIPGRENGVLVHTDAGWQLHGTIGGGRGFGRCGAAGLGGFARTLRRRRGGPPRAPGNYPVGCRPLAHCGAFVSRRSGGSGNPTRWDSAHATT